MLWLCTYVSELRKIRATSAWWANKGNALFKGPVNDCMQCCIFTSVCCPRPWLHSCKSSAASRPVTSGVHRQLSAPAIKMKGTAPDAPHISHLSLTQLCNPNDTLCLSVGLNNRADLQAFHTTCVPVLSLAALPEADCPR